MAKLRASDIRRLENRLMWRIWLSLALAGCSHSPSIADLAIRNVSVVNGRGGAPIVSDVLINEGRIASVEPAPSRAGAKETIDATGMFLIPGLIDMHVHMAGFEEHPAGFDSLLAAGVTTARDMGGDVETIVNWSADIDAGRRRGPELVYVGATLNGEANAPFHRVVTSPEKAAEAVAAMADIGAVQIKVHNAIDPDVLLATIDSARVLGLDVVGHIPPGPGPLLACEQGMKEISHAAALLESVLWRADPAPEGLVEALGELNSSESDATFACMTANRMAFAPNLSMYGPIIAGLGEPQASMTRRLVGVLGEISLRAKNAGVLIIAATDAAGDDAHPSYGQGLHDELQMLVEAGFTAGEALMTATSNAARHLKRDDLGVVVAGAQADLVLLCKDPLAEIANTRTISLVIANGLRVAGDAACR